MLKWTSCQDAKLTSSSVLMRCMRAAVALNLHRSVAMITIKGIGRMKAMFVGILQAEVLVNERVVIVEARQVKTRLGWEVT